MSSLNEYGIKNILAIDDAFYEVKGDTELCKLDYYMVQTLDTIIGNRLGFSDFVQESSDKTISDFFCHESITDGDDILKKINTNLQQSYEELMNIEGIKFFKCPPEISVIEEKLDNLQKKDEQTLIILDRMLAGDDKVEGNKILGEVLKSLKEYLTNNGNLFLVMYSSEVKDLNSFQDTLRYLEEDVKLTDSAINQVALHMNFLSKGETKEIAFIEVLRKSQKANFVNSFEYIFSESILELRDRVWDLNHNESIFHYDYLVEGQHIDQIIFDIFLDKFSASYVKHMESNFGSLINPIRNSIQKYEKNRMSEEVVEDDKVPVKYRFIKEVNSARHGGSETVPVFPSDDISFGDIIEINQDKYLVISQSCDITIRNDGKRDLQSFQLVKLKEVKQIINSKWLVKYLLDFSDNFKPKSINLNKEGLANFENTFCIKESKTELEIMGFERKYLEQIEEALKANGDNSSTKSILKEIDFSESDKEFGELLEYRLDKRSSDVFSIPCFWLDSLLLRQIGDEKNVITKESIDESKEIRLATKTYITDGFNDIISKLEFLKKEDLIKVFENRLLSPLIMVEPLFEEEILIGFKLCNITRTKKLKNHIARAIHLEMVAKQTREGLNESIPI